MMWVNLLGLIAGGLLIGMSVMRRKLDPPASLLTEAVLVVGVLDVITNGAVIAHALNLI